MIARFGDLALLIPGSLAVLILLVWSGDRRSAGAWTAAVAVCLLGTLLAKLALQTCSTTPIGIAQGRGRFESPSGHASFSTLFYIGAALIIGADRGRLVRLALAAAASVLVALIAASRIYHRVHTPEEVAVGLAIGLVSLALFMRLRGSGVRLSTGSLAGFALAALLALVGMRGVQLHAEPIIRETAQAVGAQMGLCDRDSVAPERRALRLLFHGSVQATP